MSLFAVCIDWFYMIKSCFVFALAVSISKNKPINNISCPSTSHVFLQVNVKLLVGAAAAVTATGLAAFVLWKLF